VLERAAESLTPIDVEGLADEYTRRELSVLADALDAFVRRGYRVPLQVRRGMLVGGPVTFAHRDHPYRPTRPGIRVGSQVVSADASAGELDRICARVGY
jgi:hypothetical protein